MAQLSEIPKHLQRYIVEQDYGRYTPVDQAVWRYIMKQLKSFLAKHAHPCYIEGLQKTGIDQERIPRISEMSQRLSKFGWQAVPVSGFIPPAAFMELQSLSFLPIASDMRTLSHLMYTPAPDIVHEAAGHAPILIDPAFAAYLKAYAQVAKKAIISKEDLAVYESIRILSDIKEDLRSTPEQIRAAELNLTRVTGAISHTSEASLLSRMNWWTAEYGLIGDIKNPRIFGAGLLSSVGEAKSCLGKNVKKIPLTIDCIKYTYDITEPQPQLFVTPDFETLTSVLEQLANTMAFRVGGSQALAKLKASQNTNSVQLDSGLQIGGVLQDYFVDNEQTPIFVKYSGPCQLAQDSVQLKNHGHAAHPTGFSSPIGPVSGFSTPLASASDDDLPRGGLNKNRRCRLQMRSGIFIDGIFSGWTRGNNGQILLLHWKDCSVVYRETKLFDPAWGDFDMAIGETVVSAFSGPPDRAQFGETLDFVRKIVAKKSYDSQTLMVHNIYQKIETLRKTSKGKRKPQEIEAVATEIDIYSPSDWLARLDLLELARSTDFCEEIEHTLMEKLARMKETSSVNTLAIDDGLSVIEAIA